LTFPTNVGLEPYLESHSLEFTVEFDS
jgi:hypothetical protein